MVLREDGEFRGLAMYSVSKWVIFQEDVAVITREVCSCSCCSVRWSMELRVAKERERL